MIRKIDCNEFTELNRLPFKSFFDREVFFKEFEYANIISKKPPIVKVFETKNFSEVRLYVYDETSWKYLLYYSLELLK